MSKTPDRTTKQLMKGKPKKLMCPSPLYPARKKEVSEQKRTIKTPPKPRPKSMRLDRPELREKIIEILKEAIIVGCEVQCLKCPLCSENADQILALIPDIEEAKREERERIVD